MAYSFLTIYSQSPILQKEINFTYFNKISIELTNYYEIFRGQYVQYKEFEVIDDEDTKLTLYRQQYLCEEVLSNIESNSLEDYLAITDISTQKEIITIRFVCQDRFDRYHTVKHKEREPVYLIEQELIKEILLN